MKILSKIDSGIAWIQKALLVVSMLSMSVILVANVFSRIIFKSSIICAEEIGNYAVIIITFIGMAYTARQNKHVRISSLFDIMPKKFQKVNAVIISLVTSGVVFYIAYYAFEYMSAHITSGRVSPALKIPVYVVSLIVFVGFVFTGVEYFIQFVINLVKRDEVYIGRTPYVVDVSVKKTSDKEVGADGK